MTSNNFSSSLLENFHKQIFLPVYEQAINSPFEKKTIALTNYLFLERILFLSETPLTSTSYKEP